MANQSYERMDHTMKRIVSFVILVVSFALVLMQQTIEAPSVATRPLQMWPILVYLAAVVAAGLLVVWKGRRMSRDEESA